VTLRFGSPRLPIGRPAATLRPAEGPSEGRRPCGYSSAISPLTSRAGSTSPSTLGCRFRRIWAIRSAVECSRPTLARGEIDLPKAEAIHCLVQTLIIPDDSDDREPDETDEDRAQRARRLEAELLRKARTQTLADLRKSGQRALISIDPAAAERRHKRKRAKRHTSLSPEPDGMPG
jgi:hypothetical protein